MRVKKRDNSYEDVSFDKVIRRIKTNSEDLKYLDPTIIAQYVCARIYDGVSTYELDELTAQICSSYITENPEYGILASRIIISNHHKKTSPSFSEVISLLSTASDLEGNINSLVSNELIEVVNEHKDKINDVIVYDRDYELDYFGFKTLERSYLLNIKGKVIERPQHMFMRVAIGIHGNDIKEVIETYELMSKKMMIHATPTLFNAGTPRSQMASCFLQAIKDDSINGIFDTLKDCANISKYSGGIGLHIHDIRGKGSYIRGTNGRSNGIIPMLSVYNKTSMYVDQCFRGDTNIYTINGITKIEKIREGVNVLTQDGSFHKVLSIVKKYITNDTYRVRTNNSIDTVYVTPNHNIYALINMPSLPIYELKNYMNNNIDKRPEYLELKNLTEFDYIGYPVPVIEDELTYENDLCMFSGILLGNGYIENGYQYVEFYKDKGSDMKKFLLNFLNENTIEYSTYTNKNKKIIKWLYEDNIKPISNFLDLTYECLIIFLEGLLKSNGCKINDAYNCMFYNVDESNKYLCYYIKYLFMRLGILVDGFYKSEHKYNIVCIPYCKDLYKIFNYNGKKLDPQLLNFFEFDGILWTGIKSITKMKNFVGYVYDLNIEDNHNYVTEMGIVHNSGKRNGNFAIYLEPSHPDIETFIDLRKNHGNEAERCRELFTGLWIPDLFMEKVRNDEEWCLFCPDKCKGLSDVFGDKYTELYNKYETEEKYEKKIKAQDLWKKICIAQKETGTPYICFKDACNSKSNQTNLGTIKSSNLCVSPETKIITDKGVFKISKLQDQYVNIWNGFEFSEVIIKQTGFNEILMKIEFSNGESLVCTYGHKFYIVNDEYKELIYDASELITNMELSRLSYPILDLNDSNAENYNKSLNFKTNWLKDNIINDSIEHKNLNYLLNIKQIYNTIGKDVKITNTGNIYKLQLTNDNIKVTNVIFDHKIENTFCFTEPKRNKGVFNNILTGQCAEIIEFSNSQETAVCNLASIALPMYIENGIYNYTKLYETAGILTKNLNKIIDKSFYPTKETEISNKRHRPLGIGVQGLADVYAIMNIPFDSDEAKIINKKIFETIYFGALTMSNQLAQKYGTYETYHGSPVSQGKLQFDMWNIKHESDLWDWDQLRNNIQIYGIRNSLLLALMPTASTSQILGFNECFEPFTSNIYNRRTLAGEFLVINKYLINKLIQLNLWNKDMKNKIIGYKGSIQNIVEIPEDIRNIFKTAFELHPKAIIDQAADRGIYICQSQSMNIFLDDPDISKLSNIHFYSWKKGLKTGIYYLRTRPAARVQSFTTEAIKYTKEIEEVEDVEEVEACLNCSA